MTTTTFRTNTTRTGQPIPITLEVNATALEMTVQAVPGLTEATFELSGPEEVVNNAATRRNVDRWVIDIPEPEPTVISGSGVTVMAGNVYGGVTFNGGSFSVSGDTIVNGNVISSGGDPIRATVRVPTQSSLRMLRLRNGAVRARGEYTDVDFSSTNACLDVAHAVVVEADTTNGSVTVTSATELIDVSTTNGGIDLNGTARRTRARATNGSVFVNASGPGRISARTTNGNVTVLRNGHDVDVDTSTTNGRDRVR